MNPSYLFSLSESKRALYRNQPDLAQGLQISEPEEYLYKQANILFFDEATSALDSGTEEGINRSIAELSQHNRDLTIVVIAHRESSLEYCDRIITLDNNG